MTRRPARTRAVERGGSGAVSTAPPPSTRRVTSALFELRRVADHIGGLRVVAYRYTEAVWLSPSRGGSVPVPLRALELDGGDIRVIGSVAHLEIAGAKRARSLLLAFLVSLALLLEQPLDALRQ